MSAAMKGRAREIIEQLAKLDESKRPGGGVHGQVIGMEPYVIRTTGDGLQCLFDAQVLLDELLDPFNRRPPQGELSALPKWIDDAKGKDPFTDDLIYYIERRQSGDAADKRDAALDELAAQFSQPYMEYFGSDIQDAIKAIKAKG